MGDYDFEIKNALEALAGEIKALYKSMTELRDAIDPEHTGYRYVEAIDNLTEAIEDQTKTIKRSR